MSENCQKIFLVGNFQSKNAQFVAEKHFCPLLPNLGPKLIFPASIIGNLQQSVGILSKICSVCQKIATSCPAYFFDHRCRWRR